MLFMVLTLVVWIPVKYSLSNAYAQLIAIV